MALPDPLSPTAGRTLRALVRQERATRPELAAGLGVTKQTVSAAIAELEERGFVAPLAVQQGRTGRSALRYGLAPGAGWVAGVDLGPQRLRVAAARIDGTVVADRLVAKPAPSTSRDWPDQLEVAAHALSELSRDLPEAEGGLLGAGVALHRPVARVADLVGEHLDEADARLLAALAPVAPAAAWTENDVKCAALAQLRYLPGPAPETVLHLQVGQGVGAAVVVGGRVLRGARGRAGEVRDLPSPLPGGGTVEEALGIAGLMRRAGRPLETPPATALDELLARDAAGDPGARDALQQEAEGIAALLAQLCAVVDPDVVLLSGELGGRPRLRGLVQSAMTGAGLREPLADAPLGDAAAVLGASWLAAERVLAALAGPERD